MKYIYETHLHTNAGSLCGVSDPEDYIKPYKNRGFTGIIVTEHFFNGNCAVNRHLTWKKQVDAFSLGYERAKKAGEKYGLDVFFGWEARLGNDEYLVYGLDKQWLYYHPEIPRLNQFDQYDLIHNSGGAVVQAHPYRERIYESAIDLYPYCVDAVEGYNLCNSRWEDARSCAYAERFGLCKTAGSDAHTVMLTQECEPFGVISDHRWDSIKDYVTALLGHNQLELNLASQSCQREQFTLGLADIIHNNKPRAKL